MNLSYCRFENTSLDMRDCVSAMMEAERLSDLDLSTSEMSSLKYLRTFCEAFLEEAERLLDAESQNLDME
jgi:hypothetical protein